MIQVYRWRHATPQLNVGHVEAMAALDRELSAHPALAVTASGFRGTGIADCVGDARFQTQKLYSQELEHQLDSRLLTCEF